MNRKSLPAAISSSFAALALVASLPLTANAATTKTQYAPTILSFNGAVESQPQHVIAPDPWSGHSTSWLPVWYLYHSLQPMGVSAVWDGTHRILTFQVPSSVKADLSNLPQINWTGKSGEMLIQFNAGGSVYSVMTCPYLAAPDPADNIETSYTPEYYVMLALKRLGITSNWNGTDWAMTTGSTTVTPPSTGTQENKLQAALAMAQVLGIKGSGAVSYSDVPSSDSAIIAAETQSKTVAGQTVPAMFPASSATDFGSSSGVTAEDIDAAYAAWVGIASANQPYVPGGNLLSFGNSIGLNANVPSTGDLTTSQFSQMMSNLKTIQRGYVSLGNGRYRLVYTPQQGSFGPGAMPQSMEAQDAAKAVQYINSVVVTVTNGQVTAALPGVSDTSGMSNVVWSSSNQYSNNGGQTWQTASWPGYVSDRPSHGGMSNPPQTVLVRGSATGGIEIQTGFDYNGQSYGFISDVAGISGGNFVTKSS